MGGSLSPDVRRTPGESEPPKEGTVLFDTHGAYQNRGADVLTEIGNRINRFLNGEEITASVLCHHVIICLLYTSSESCVMNGRTV